MPLKTHLDEEPALNLTSMIDVLFLLIIFFMAGAKFTELERKIDLRVPQITDGKQLPAAPEKVSVNVFRDGTLTLNNQPVALDELTRRLKQWKGQNPRLTVIVRGDGDGPLQNVANVLNACGQAGVSDMGIAVRLANRDASEKQ